mmetsp:Transcript_22059/g.77326  ORF Transcript_22059/g.77326 Transcript_22059/m.77326 type:complete len:203 (-) Transcript_22059:6366-6974(-)
MTGSWRAPTRPRLTRSARRSRRHRRRLHQRARPRGPCPRSQARPPRGECPTTPPSPAAARGRGAQRTPSWGAPPGSSACRRRRRRVSSTRQTPLRPRSHPTCRRRCRRSARSPALRRRRPASCGKQQSCRRESMATLRCPRDVASPPSRACMALPQRRRRRTGRRLLACDPAAAWQSNSGAVSPVRRHPPRRLTSATSARVS